MESSVAMDEGYTIVTPGSSRVTNETNNSTGPAYERDETLAKAEIAVLAVILYLALFGNLVVIVVLLYRKRKLSRMQMFIIHLAVADISVALFQVIPQLVMDITNRFDGNDFLCKLTKYMQVATMYSSTYVLIMTALDRYMSICHPLTSQTWTTRRVHLMVLIAWILSGLFSIPQLFIFSYGKSPYNGEYFCGDNFVDNAHWKLIAYVLWIFISVYAIPLVMLTVCYGKICHVVWVSVNAKENHNSSEKPKRYLRFYKSNSDRSRSTKNANTSIHKEIRKPRAHSKKMSKSKIKTVKLTLTVVICFIICWAPFFITQVWATFDLNAFHSSPIIAIAMLLANLNSCTNPWIYLAFSGRLCKRQQRPRSKTTWMSSANTYTTEAAGETMRMRKITSDSFNRSFEEKDTIKPIDDV